jgi:small subunit ribosomal protein S1
VFFKNKKNYRQENLYLMEIYKDLTNPASQEFEKLLNSQLSKIQIEEGKIHRR